MYDIIIIGAGSGGLNIAVFMASTGLKVLLIDKKDESIGGDCLNHGCVPSKSLIHIAREIHTARAVGKYGVTASGDVDLSMVMKSVQEKIATIRKHENAEHFRNLGIDVVLGHAQFTNEREVSVNGKSYVGKNIILATGSRPRKLTVPVGEHAHVISNEDIFTLTQLPKKLVVVGVGPIGIELGQAFLMLGSTVTFIGNESRILPREKEEYAEVIYSNLLKQGATFQFSNDVIEIKDDTTIIIKNKDTQEMCTLQADIVLVAIGRQLNIENLGLENAGIEVEKGKVVVDEHLRTTNKHVYLCGDVAGGYQFTHAAELHAQVILNNLFNPFSKKKVSYDAFSWVTYTTPELATFGQSEDTLRATGKVYEKLETTFMDDDRAITSGTEYGKSEVYVDARSKKILGGTMVADNAGELVQEIILSLEAGVSINHIFNKIYPYPVASRINKSLISNYFRKRFSDSKKQVLRFLYGL
jgi:pyruvate/2-oxoglutarate dehydrogenase complex dihydrolipoamide dehydrogenase (E3) component